MCGLHVGPHRSGGLAGPALRSVYDHCLVELYVGELLRVRVLHPVVVGAAVVGLAVDLGALSNVEAAAHLVGAVLGVRADLVARAVQVHCRRHRAWNAANHIVSEGVLLVLRRAQGVEETSAQVLAALPIRIKFRDIILRCLGKITSCHVLHARLVDDVRLELLSDSLASIIAYEHDLHILLMWMVLCLLSADQLLMCLALTRI